LDQNMQYHESYFNSNATNIRIILKNNLFLMKLLDDFLKMIKTQAYLLNKTLDDCAKIASL